MTIIKTFGQLVGFFSLLSATLLATAQDLVLHSTAAYSELNKPLFIADFYAREDNLDIDRLLSGDSPFEMRLTVEASSIGSRRFSRAWLEGVTINNSIEKLQPMNPHLAEFSNLFKGRLLRGDDFRVRYTHNGITVVSLNGITLQTLPGHQFGPLLLSCWLGQVPLSASFKESLIQGQADSAAQARRDQLSYSKERQAKIQTWLPPAPGTTVAKPPKIIPKEVSKPRSATEKQTKIIETFTANSKPALKTAKAKPVAVTKPETVKPAAAKQVVVTQAAKPVVAPTINKDPEPKKVEPATNQQATATPPVNHDKPEALQDTEALLALRQEYYKTLINHLQHHKTIPYTAFQRRWEGEVKLLVTINRGGEIIDHQTLKESRRKVFNEQAQDALQRAIPFPVIPSELQGESFSFTALLQYRLN